MKLIVIGSASGMASPSRSHSCYLVDSAGKLYMFDCGDGSASALLRCRVDTSSVMNIFISHTHPDHICGLPMVIQTEHLKNRRQQLTIHLPSEFEHAFWALMNAFYLFRGKLGFDIVVRTIDEGFLFDDGRLRVEAHANSHLRPTREFLSSGIYSNRMQCFSFIIVEESRRLVYSSDVGSAGDLSAIAPGADLLLTEGMHLDLGPLPDFLIANNVKRCVLTHLPDGFDRNAAKMMFSKSGYQGLDFADEAWTTIV